MQTSRMMTLGPKTLLQTHNVPLCHKTNLSLFPRRLYENHTLSRKPTKQDSFNVTAISGDLESTRPSAQFTPSTFFGDDFFSVPLNDSEYDAIENEIEMVMKPYVRDMLMSSDNCDKEKIRLIHLLISLAIAHYFEEEIEEILNQAFGKLEGLIAEEDDLETISIMFEVFRLYGHKMSCAVFEIFKREHDGKFKESLAGDVKGLLQLYQASYLKTTDEDIMDEARSFTRKHLKVLTNTHPHLSRHIQNALYIPRYHSLEIAVAREYISLYEKEEDHEEKLLKFAKLNFRYCQVHYVQELKAITKWGKELDLASKLPFSFRDRNIEIYFVLIGTYFEPRYSHARIIGTKISVIMTLIDDLYDSYATLPEAISFTDALQRWDIGAIADLPNYMQIIFRTLWDIVKDIEREMGLRGRYGGVQPTVDKIKHLTKEGYLELAKWARAGHVPSFEEYMKVGVVTSSMLDFAFYSFLGMEDCDEKILYEWLVSGAKYIEAICAEERLINDIATYEEELKRGEVANGLNCYMKQYGVSKEKAVTALKKMIRDHHEIMIEEFFNESSTVPRQILVRLLNSERMVQLIYTDGDGFGHPDKNFKSHITSLFL